MDKPQRIKIPHDRTRICKYCIGDFAVATFNKYGLALCDESARVALYSIPKEKVKVLNLHIFSVNEYGEVIQFTPRL